MAKKIIFNGDMGGDDIWALFMLSHMVNSEKYDLLGIGTIFGNTTVEQATRNVLDALPLTHISGTSVYEGSKQPISNLPPLLDGAYGENGLSNATLPYSNLEPQKQHSVQWLIDTLSSTDDPITIIATGPLTDIAKAIQASPDIASKGHEIIWLGGSILPTGAEHTPILLKNGTYKKGNITDFAEFNAINDPVAAQIVADSNIKLTIMPLDATQHMVVGWHQATEFSRKTVNLNPALAANLLSMLDQAVLLDSDKFNVAGGFLHDPANMAYVTSPTLFLPAQAIANLSFTNDHELAKKFNPIACNFDFSQLGHHGQMAAAPTQTSNNFLVPGLTTFTSPDMITNDQKRMMNEMCAQRWKFISNAVAKGMRI